MRTKGEKERRQEMREDDIIGVSHLTVRLVTIELWASAMLFSRNRSSSPCNRGSRPEREETREGGGQRGSRPEREEAREGGDQRGSRPEREETREGGDQRGSRPERVAER